MRGTIKISLKHLGSFQATQSRVYNKFQWSEWSAPHEGGLKSKRVVAEWKRLKQFEIPNKLNSVRNYALCWCVRVKILITIEPKGVLTREWKNATRQMGRDNQLVSSAPHWQAEESANVDSLFVIVRFWAWTISEINWIC